MTNTSGSLKGITVGVVVATLGRPSELAMLLTSLTAQSLLPSIVVVVDASDEDVYLRNSRTVRSFEGHFKVLHTYSSVRSSSTQRNIGAKLCLEEGVDLIQILDDDTQPASDYLERLSRAVLQLGAIGSSGVARVPGDEKSITPPGLKFKLMKIFYVFSGLESWKSGVISLAGCGIPVAINTPGIRVSEWLFGCSMWNANIFRLCRFNEKLPGAALGEDLEFSLDASKYGKLYVDTSAVLWHSMSNQERPNEALFAHRFSRNRIYAVRKHRLYPLSLVSYFVSVAFLALIYFYQAIRFRDAGKFSSVVGTIRGALHAAYDKAPI